MFTKQHISTNNIVFFYKLSKISKAKTLMLQKGKRTRSDRIFNNKSLIKESQKESFYVGYIFLYN